MTEEFMNKFLVHLEYMPLEFYASVRKTGQVTI